LAAGTKPPRRLGHRRQIRLDVAGATNYGLRFRLRRPAKYAG
jgi:hypothetical protein